MKGLASEILDEWKRIVAPVKKPAAAVSSVDEETKELPTL